MSTPSDARIPNWQEQAREYLSRHLEPPELTHLGTFEERPLEDEGAVALFGFAYTPNQGGSGCALGLSNYCVAVGETEPNFFPAYDLPPDDLYSIHVGTRFMLTVKVGLTDPQRIPPDALDRLHRVVHDVAPGETVESTDVAAVFDCDGEIYAVYRVQLRGSPYYFMGGACPPGFYALTDLPPQAVLRLHLGKLIRAEAQRDTAPLSDHADRG